MMSHYEIRYVKDEELEKALEMVANVFKRFVAPDYIPEGVFEFMNFIEPEEMRKRLSEGFIMYVAVGRDDGEIAGVIVMRDCTHISMLFTDEKHQGKGIAKSLFIAALEDCLKRHPNLDMIGVNSSPYAVPIYEHMGFKQLGPEEEQHGIRFVRMVKQI